MRKGWLARFGVAGAIGWMALGANTGCSGEKDPIVQVQDNYIRKTDLIGTDAAKSPSEWYVRTTVIDTRRTNPFAFPGMQDTLRRVRWDVQEKYLIARLSYEIVSGTDGKGNVAKPKLNDGTTPVLNDGIIVAMYPITSHFDIRRAYNSATGEEQNVLVENSTDRPWNEREFVRVDWSENLVSDPDFESIWFPKIFGELNLQPVNYFETDPKSPNHPIFDFGNGYFDITSKWMMSPDSFDFGDGFKFPKCVLFNLITGSDATDCADQEVTVRTSYMKVPEHGSAKDRDYEAAETTPETFSMFGTFNRDRYGYDRQYGLLDNGWHRFMARHNIWDKSHDTRSCGADHVKASADVACSSVAGSTCDMNKHLCTLPVQSRKIRQVPYYVSTNMPEDLWTANQALIGEWNAAMTDAVGSMREVECRRAGGDRDTCHAKWYDADAPKAVDGPVVVLCHNPVWPYTDPSGKVIGQGKADPTSCGVGGTIAREGDLRYNLIGWVDQALSAAPLGYGPDGADPLTGEVVQATAYIYGASLDNYAAMTRDLIEIANGDMDPEKFALGDGVAASVGTYNPGVKLADQPLYQQYATYLSGKLDRNLGGAMTETEIAQRLSGVDASEMVRRINATAAVSGLDSATARVAAVNATTASLGVAGVAGFGGAGEADAHIAALGKLAAGSATENNLVDDKYLLANALTDQGSEADMKHMTTPFGGMGMLKLSEMRQAFRDNLESKGHCLLGTDEFNAPNIVGIASRLKDKYKDVADATERRNKIFMDLRWIIYKAVTEHEVGHTMALRHNFQGSWDSVNYHPNYWKLRTADGAASGACTTARDPLKPDNCMGPRYLDPASPEENGNTATPHAGIEEFAYSSIMDYGYDFNSDLHGIGSYDKAAMKFIYGGVVETFDTAAVDADTVSRVAPVLSSPITEQWLVKRNDPKIPGGDQVQPTHYTQLGRMLKLYDASRCHDATPTEIDNGDAINGQVCTPIKKDIAHVSDMKSGDVVAGRDDTYAPLWKSDTGAIRWPYRFGTDEYAHYPHILRFDAGADLYEGAVNLKNLYEYRYILDFYRRGRRQWISFFIGNRLWDRYFSRMHTLGWQAAAKTVAYSAAFPDKTAANNPLIQSDDWGRGYAMAASVLFETLERSMLRPQPGQYTTKAGDPDQNKQLYEVPSGTAPKKATFQLGVVDGRYVDEVFDNEVGGSFNYLNYMVRTGTYEEKPIATIALSAMWPPVHVYSRDTYIDGRNVQLNFRSVLPKAYDRLIGGVLSEDWDTIAPFVNKSAKDADGNSAVVYTNLWADTVARPANATLVDPLVGYKTQKPSIILSLYFGTSDGSQTLTNSMRIWLEGGPEAITIPDSEKVRLYEPESGVTWAARRGGTETIDGKEVETSIGARMLLHANVLLAQAYKVKTGPDGLPVYGVDGKVEWADGAKPNEQADPDQVARFRQFIGVINVERQAMANFGFGPLRFD